MPQFKLKSALELAEDSDWRIPSFSARKRVKIGEHVRLYVMEPGNRRECIWVKVISRTTARYTGRVKYDPYQLKLVKTGMTIVFLPKHVVTIDLTMR